MWTAMLALLGGGLMLTPHALPELEKGCRACHLSEPAVEQQSCERCHFSPYPTDRLNNAPRGDSPHPQPVAQKAPPSGEKDMALIPAGPFIMGYDDRHPDEGPSHTVRLDAFYMDLYEVSNAQYKAFVDATGHPPPPVWPGGNFPDGLAEHPVVYVSWFDARDYCDWRGKRLATEEEWEKAARGTDGRIFPWGNQFDINKANTPQRWAALKQRGGTLPVGSFPDGRSPYGLYDMGGNVWEWTASWYLPYPGNTHVTENYGRKYKVAKGGSWKNCSFYRCGVSAPTFNRGFFQPKTMNSGFGFRCAKDAAKAE